MMYTIVFFTHSGAIKFNRKMVKENISCELMPVPRRLSSNCGIGAKVNFVGDYIELISDDIEKIFLYDNEKEKLVYESE
ncbi:hypothetical protein SH2C18_27060 [Clostridium sediminicola]|uniref:DUF3343 domain-containing protein n=1 Tax=Clostridium sediminicola TaxID=3114879 RepID=UPI0031F1DC0C